MCTVTQKEPTKSTTIEQENTHLNAALLEEQRQTARQEKKQLAEQDKAQQAIIAQQEATVVNQQKQISALNEKLIANTKQEQVLIGRLEQVEKQRQKKVKKNHSKQNSNKLQYYLSRKKTNFRTYPATNNLSERFGRNKKNNMIASSIIQQMR